MMQALHIWLFHVSRFRSVQMVRGVSPAHKILSVIWKDFY